jgi:MraZ protein
VLFTGHYEHTIDAKHRLAIPADIRSRWNPVTDGAAFFAVPWVGGVIRLYTESDFHQRAGAAPLTLTPDEDEAELQATLFGLSRRIDLDSAGRIRIPEDLLELTGLQSDVVLVGAGDRLEIRDRAAWAASKSDRLNKLPELMRRITARKGPAKP